MRNKIILLFSAVSFSNAFAQDIHFSQFYDSPLNMSPALAGMDNSHARAILNYRNQWSAFGKPFQTFSGSFDMPLLKNKNENAYLGAGLNIFHDKAGNTGLSKMLIAGNISSILKVGAGSYFSIGFQGAFNQRSINLTDVRWDNQFNGTAYDPTLSSGESSGILKNTFFDMGGGIAYKYSSSASDIASNDDFTMTIAGGAFHLNRPDQGLMNTDKINMRYSGMLKMHIGIKNTNMAFEPIASYMKHGGISEMNMGLLVRYLLKSGSSHTTLSDESAVSFGVCYRLKDALYPIISYDFSNYSIGISYDINLSTLTPYSQSRGGFEVVIKIRDVMGTWFGAGGGARFY
jgi:type IX secretion system PorP/SprF family membrane protein